MAYRIKNNNEANFLAYIEKLVKTQKMSFYDATIQACADLKVDPEQAGQVIKKNTRLKMKIQKDVNNLHLLRKRKRKKKRAS